MKTLAILLALSLVAPGQALAPEIRTGRIVIHDAFPVVLQSYPERIDPGVDGYIATSDCREIGERFVLVRPGQPDALVAVADCAWSYHVQYRERMRYIADVDRKLWTGEEAPQYAEIWPVGLRDAFIRERQEHEIELRWLGIRDN